MSSSISSNEESCKSENNFAKRRKMNELPTVDENRPSNPKQQLVDLTPSSFPAKFDGTKWQKGLLGEASLAARSEVPKSTEKWNAFTNFLGRDHGIPFEKLSEFIEYKRLFLEDVEGHEWERMGEKVLNEILANPLQSILLSTPYNNPDRDRKIRWKTLHDNAVVGWENKKKRLIAMEGNVEYARKVMMEKKAILDKAQNEYDTFEKFYTERKYGKDDLQKEMMKDYEVKEQALTLLNVRAHLEQLSWKDKDDKYAREKLNLKKEEDVKVLRTKECKQYLCLLKAAKYHETNFFQGLWGKLAPESYKREQWTDLYGDKPKISLANATKKDYHKRICDYLNIPTGGEEENGGREDEAVMIPANAKTDEDLEKAEEKAKAIAVKKAVEEVKKEFELERKKRKRQVLDEEIEELEPNKSDSD